MFPVQETFTKEFFEKIFKKQIKDFAKVLNVNVTDIFEIGESFTSELLKILVTYSTTDRDNRKNLSVVVKFLKDTEEVVAISKDLKLYREFDFFEEILPLITEMDKPTLNETKFLDLKQKFAPRVYFVSKVPKSMLIMEDMSVAGYKMQNRHDGLDLKHCLMVMEKLAYFHAASAVLYEKNPEIMAEFKTGTFNDNGTMKNVLFLTYPELMKVLSKIPGLQSYSDKMPIVEEIYKKITSAAKPSDTFNVLNHGDLWCNNILFQYQENEEVSDVVFIDYQLSCFGSPFIDLHYFFSSSIKSQNKVDTINTLLNHYIGELLSNLKKFNINKSPTREGLLKDFYERAIIGLGTMCIATPIFKAQKEKDATLENFLGEGVENHFRHNCFNNPEYLKSAPQLLPFYNSLGVFD
ncbi:hypothetical protein FQA39_LY02861 [Lamprigera yunnana]|nr:hypothetical protein FQA39_LY02861 [Lamprigera yunnana]